MTIAYFLRNIFAGYISDLGICLRFGCVFHGFGLIIICNSSPPGQNSCHFADDVFMCIFVNEKFYSLIKISLKIVPKGPIDNN